MAGWDMTRQMRMQPAGGKQEMGCYSQTADTASPEFPTSLTRIWGGFCVASSAGSTAKVGHVVGDPSYGYVDFTVMEATAGPFTYIMWGY